ncbi:nitroreductase family protein [Pseudomonas sp. SO81]|uniref:nitroreductase family protein n=1 Tax=Pseudomonas sp. SO81 TaxID=2983246 RepID=UPI0025A45E64|nr:nitroreductase family protein [Pseudomonas sp. SO81]WJN58412.1 Nitroreductase family protein [Pseudomonas sp. SO81]
MSTPRQTEYAIHPQFLERWSPRAFTGEAIAEQELFALFEAARWAPSANNAQPWRFVYARNGSPNWARLFDLLGENNRRWAAKAAALVVLISRTHHRRPGASEDSPLLSHSLDSGAAWASLALQAQHSGWSSHAIGGFDRERARSELGVPDGYQVELAIAIGRRGDAAELPEDLRAREQPTQRQPLASLVAEGRFSFASA